MKKLFPLAISVLLIQSAQAGTLPLMEHFAYTAGVNLGSVGNGWSGSTSAIGIGSGNLDGTGLGLTNSSGNMVATSSSSGTTYNLFADSGDYASGSIYFSFLLKVNDANSVDAAGEQIAAVIRQNSSSQKYAGIYLKNVAGAIQAGIAKTNASPTYITSGTGSAIQGSTVLVAAKYSIVSGSDNDMVRLWVNPGSLGGTEDGSPQVTISTGGDHVSGSGPGRFYLYGGVTATIDELRISTNWADVTPAGAPLPPRVPHITNTMMTPAGLRLRGTNGSAGGVYTVLATANVMVPQDQWPVIATNAFDGNGNFDCTNPVTWGQAQQFYRLRVGGSLPPPPTAPSITTQPQNQAVTEGQNATFTVVASGSAPLHYDWHFNTNTPLASGTNATLTVTNAQEDDEGGYFVIVTNSVGSVTSVVATLTVSPPATNGDFYVSPTGNDDNPGTLALPFATIVKAIAVAAPGDVIYVRGGTYNHATTIRIEKSGAGGAPIKLLAYPGEQPVFNFSSQPYGSSNRGILITTNGNWWEFKGLEICYAGDNAVKVEGSHHCFEQCVFHHNGDTGLQIGFGHDDENPGGLLAAFIEVVNCDSYLNYDSDSNGGDADGFAAKMHCGQGIVFHGCRAWENSDDGWDLFETDYSIVISNCWTWRSGVGQGNGNGFKLGGNGSGGNSMGTHYAYNCVSFSHKVNGFTQNSHKDGLVVINCLGFSNGSSGYNYFMEGSLNPGKQNVFKNNASIPRSGTNTGGFIEDNNPIQQNNSWNLSVTVNSGDYGDITETAAKAPRQPDGSLPTGFARLVSGSDLIDQGVDVGIPYNGTAPDLGAYEFQP